MTKSALNFKIFNLFTSAIGMNEAQTNPHNDRLNELSIMSNSMLTHYLVAPAAERQQVLTQLQETLNLALDQLQTGLALIEEEQALLQAEMTPLSNTES